MDKNINKKLIYIICGVLIIAGIGVAYALWTSNFTQTGTNTATYDCFKVNFSGSGTMSLSNTAPMSDAEGLITDPFTLTISNTCKTKVTYNVMYNVLKTSTLASNLVRVSVGSSVKTLTGYSTVSTTSSNFSSSYKIASGVLGANTSTTLYVRNWVIESATSSNAVNKSFSSIVTAEAVATR